ncbi:MAG TPA: hypothetical protein VHZ03_08370 [Trebonia sp.]|jgi:hypothetical protein|nr:hypothetical protein [Trebonia sp.]
MGRTGSPASSPPPARPLSAAEADAQVLKALAADGFPAERCSTKSPVSVLHGQPLLVTVGRGSVAKAVQDHQAVTWQAQEIASHARRAFDAD